MSTSNPGHASDCRIDHVQRARPAEEVLLRIVDNTATAGDLVDGTFAATRTRRYGVGDMGLARAITHLLASAGIETIVDVGQQGWPATVWVDLTDASRETVGFVRRTLDAAGPWAIQLRWEGHRSTSVRVAAPRAAGPRAGTETHH